MVRNVWVLLLALFLIEANGFRLFAISLSSEETDSDSAIDESDYWDMLAGSNGLLDLEESIKDDEKWNRIDNLELFDDIDDDDDESVEVVELEQHTEMQATKIYRLGKRVRGNFILLNHLNT